LQRDGGRHVVEPAGAARGGHEGRNAERERDAYSQPPSTEREGRHHY
jgi:hypothetical protein